MPDELGDLAPEKPAAVEAEEGGEQIPGAAAAAEETAQPEAGTAHGSQPKPKEEDGWGRKYTCKDGRYGFQSVRKSTLREREPKRPRVRRTRKRRSSPHRRRKNTHPKERQAPRQQEERRRERSISKSCLRPDEL